MQGGDVEVVLAPGHVVDGVEEDPGLGVPKPGIPASTISACESLALIVSWEIFSRLTYFWADWATLDPGVKNFFRLGSFQICQ